MATWLVIGILGLVVSIIFTVLFLIAYSGLFHNIEIKAGKPPFKNLRIAYKCRKGPYKNAGDLFTESAKLAPGNRCLGVYYDDPHQVAAEELRYIVGAVLAEGTEEPDKKLEAKLLENGYKIATLPNIDYAVTTSFPFVTAISIYIAIFRVYPLLGDYVKRQKLCARPVLEMYCDDVIHFWAPLAKQDEFYVAGIDVIQDEMEQDDDGGKLKEGEKIVSGGDPNEKTPSLSGSSGISGNGSTSGSGSASGSGSESPFEELDVTEDFEEEMRKMQGNEQQLIDGVKDEKEDGSDDRTGIEVEQPEK
ncbi:testis-expressed protein 264-like [Saccoglossus kowalevskii]|uniref:Testis-expressed sequence 264 protein-like n=1 Tax=Saccoglossus kowalevskii TaxID=10224 RepID=A0ABM0GVP9_SACKO|nr:PREDICTED: testis-expressed sequence 264 protein-like [Saccoglossus kowalevskii]